MYHVLLHLRSSLSPGDFFHLLDDSVSPNLSPAIKLLQVYARQGDRQLLRDFYYQDDRRTESACLEMEEAGSAEVSPATARRCTMPTNRTRINGSSTCAMHPSSFPSIRTERSKPR